jgi:hypothetical protein
MYARQCLLRQVEIGTSGCRGLVENGFPLDW